MFLDFRKLLSSFKFAAAGMKNIFKEENAFRIELLIALLVVIASFYFKLPPLEKAVVFVVIFLVLATELTNSLLERILNMVNSSFDPRIKKLKDASSALVLLSCIMAAIVGITIFLPRFLDKFFK